MNRSLVDQVAAAVLYEGYILYPYRPSSVKNQQRWTFGGIYPRAYAEANPGADNWQMETECLLRGGESSTITVSVRFLHLMDRAVQRRIGEGFEAVSTVEVNGRSYRPWQEAVERTVEIGPVGLGELVAGPHRQRFGFEANRSVDPLGEVARLVREQRRVEGSVEILVEAEGDGVFRLSVMVQNNSAFARSLDMQGSVERNTAVDIQNHPHPDPLPAYRERGAELSRDAALMQSLVSSHFILTIQNGGFISLTDPPAALQSLASGCRQIGCWPVLVGESGSTDALLVSPIILPDYPQIAPESPGDLFDGCEIDEILTLRILTMTDDEKRQAAAADPMAAQLLARTESLAREQLMNLHGAIRGLQPSGTEAVRG